MSVQAEQVQERRQQQDAASVEFVEALLNVRRVAKVIRGGRRFAFSALVVVGDRNGKVGIALGKGREVSAAIAKAFKRARKNLVAVPLFNSTVPFETVGFYGASKVILRGATKGTGVIAGGAMRTICDAAGIKDVLAKSIGSSNPQNVAKATFAALGKLRSARQIAKLRGKTIAELIEGSNVAA